MIYEKLTEVPTDLIVTDPDDWVYEYRHGVWGYRQPKTAWSGEQTGEFHRWFAFTREEVESWSEFGPFEYTEV